MNAFRTSALAGVLPLVLLLGLGGAAAASPEGPRDDDALTSLDLAMAHYERCEWELAYAALVPLADAGNREAARIALLMRAHGSRLFGHTFMATSAQREHWLDAASWPRPQPEFGALRL